MYFFFAFIRLNIARAKLHSRNTMTTRSPHSFCARLLLHVVVIVLALLVLAVALLRPEKRYLGIGLAWHRRIPREPIPREVAATGQV